MTSVKRVAVKRLLGAHSAVAPLSALTTDTESYISGKSITDTYRTKQLREHILSDPDTYAGNIDFVTEPRWVMRDGKMTLCEVSSSEVFYKMFDETLVNAIDQATRLESCIQKGQKVRKVTDIRVTLNREEGYISVENNGDGIDVAMHDGEGKYVPEVLFGTLLTSANYNKDEEKITGGKNGYGAKITNIYSSRFYIETVDAYRKLKFTQTFTNNMSHCDAPEIVKCPNVPYTKITYYPDWKRFSVTDFTKLGDWQVLEARVYGAAACTPKYTNIWLNGVKLACKSFNDYISLYVGEAKRFHFMGGDRWECAVVMNEELSNKMEQVSFVNGIFTDRGGKHVDNVADHISALCAAAMNEKGKKDAPKIMPTYVKNNLWIFVKCSIVNPNFDTQTKRLCSTAVKNFGSKCEYPADIADKILKLGLAERALNFANAKAKTELSKQNNGKKGTLASHVKLHNARHAGTSRASKCTLVVTEGDSAANYIKSAMKALTEEQQAYWGWFPLRGKLLNVKTATLKQLSENVETRMLQKIIGLKSGVVYNTQTDLNYGRLMVLADADDDGDHIKGLIANWLHENWPSLLKTKGFFASFPTEIWKAWRPPSQDSGDIPDFKTLQCFYSEEEYAEWKKSTTGKWITRRYKGLGTHSQLECEYGFKNRITTDYLWHTGVPDLTILEQSGDEKDETPLPALPDLKGSDASQSLSLSGCVDEKTELLLKSFKDQTDMMFNLVFAKKFENARKAWIRNFLLRNEKERSYKCQSEDIPEFFNYRMIRFSVADLKRSIPNLIDGQKPAQRKIIYGAFKRKLVEPTKVAIFGGYVAEHTAYHHAEQGIGAAIITMAADFVGSKNLNIFTPIGSFGTRAEKGNDAAAARYINTKLSDIAYCVFDQRDNSLLKYLEEEDKRIEPEYYVPIIPIVLANGAEGIGTGSSSNIPTFNPFDIIDNLLRALRDEPLQEMTPWVRGFTGRIEKVTNMQYKVTARYEITSINTVVRVYDLPAGDKMCKSVVQYKEFLDKLLETESDSLQKYEVICENNTDFVFDLHFYTAVTDVEKFEKTYHLSKNLNLTNMNLFNSEGILKKYYSPLQIIKDFMVVREALYIRRREHIINELEIDLSQASARFKFVTEIMNDTINIYRKKKADIQEILRSRTYPIINSDCYDYEYLLKMRIDSFTQETLARLQKEISMLEEQLISTKNKTHTDMWREDLYSLRQKYDESLDTWYYTNSLVRPAAKKCIPTKRRA